MEKARNMLASIAFGELCEQLSYYGLQSILVIYLANIFMQSADKSFSLLGAFAYLSFSLPVLGGIVADKWLGQYKAIIYGALLLIVGNLLLQKSTLPFFYGGLGVIACGMGLYKPNCTSLVGQLYEKKPLQQEKAFRFFYIAMNIGCMLGPVVYGLLYQEVNWHIPFIVSAILIFINLCVLLWQRGKKLHPIQITTSPFLSGIKRELIILGTIAIFCVLLISIFFHSEILKYLLIGIFFAAVYVIGKIIKENHSSSVIALVILFFFMMIFFSASFQVLSSINVFIENHIDRTIFGYSLPATVFVSIYPLAIILLAVPVKWLLTYFKSTSPITKIAAGLLAASLAFVCFSLASFLNNPEENNYYPLMWIVIGDLLLGAGEICLMPALLACVSSQVSRKFRSTMMGILYVFIAFAGYLSAEIAKLSTCPLSMQLFGANKYTNFFVEISVSMLVFTIVLLCLKSSFSRLLSVNEKSNTPVIFS